MRTKAARTPGPGTPSASLSADHFLPTWSAKSTNSASTARSGFLKASPNRSGRAASASVKAPPPASAARPRNTPKPDRSKEVFDEFAAELGEMGGEDEDLETHYNLGIAFREWVYSRKHQ